MFFELNSSPTFVSVKAGDGSAASPSIGFSAQATGLFRLGSSSINISIGGTERYDFRNGIIYSKASSNQQSYFMNGSTGFQRFCGGSIENASAELMVYGSTHASRAIDFELLAAGTAVVSWDHSADLLALGKNSSTVLRINATTTSAGAATATLTNAPTGAAGDPDTWLTVNINGTEHVIPAWTP